MPLFLVELVKDKVCDPPLPANIDDKKDRITAAINNGGPRHADARLREIFILA